MKLNFRLLNSIMFCVTMGLIAFFATASTAWGLGVGGGLMLAGTQTKAGVVGMATPDTSALGAYAGKYMKELFATLRANLTILNDLKVIPGIKNTIKLTKLTVKDGVRTYRETFDADDSDLQYSGRDLSVELLKRDLLINPLKYRSTWLSEVMKPGVNIHDIPFAQFTNNQILIQIAHEIQKGSYLAVKGAGSTLATSFDGIGTIIANMIADETANAGTGLVPIATGAITNTNAVAKFEQMVAAMPSEFIEDGFEIKAGFDKVRAYQQDYRERYGKYKEKNENGLLEIEDVGGKVVIKPCSWMGTSGRLIASPYDNLLAGVDGLADQDNIITDLELEIIKYRILFALGFQIRDKDAIKVNDQA